MNLSHNRKIYDGLFFEIAKLHDDVEYRKSLNDYRKNIKNSRQRKDYPAVSVGAEFNGICAIGHHHAESSKNDFHPLIYQELLNRLGNLNERSSNNPNCESRVGHCAENYAASGVLKEKGWNGAASVLGSLEFTKAFQPRTWKNKEWCDNCKTMFS